ncbi:hypothetical protein B0O99DRAFT_691928 [Bisporella sp. PMI_857]|nr:hypothetical protein B0O99DRAFT_691928 [Bisporella sp. PMI_857]
MAQPPTIPQKGISEPSYAVHRPETSAEASSAGPSASQEQHQDDGSNTPPPYSGPTSPSLNLPSQSVSSISHHPGLPRLNYALYAPPTFSLSSDAATLTSQDPTLSVYPAKLISLIQSLASIPPKPIIRITGRCNDTLDFDVKINCMNLIIPEDTKRRMNYVKTIGHGETGWRGDTKETTTPTVTGGLEEWARKYCADQSSIKHFLLKREVSNWDTSYLEGRLLSLVSSTAYLGQVTVKFPVTHEKVLVKPPDKINKFFSSVTKVFAGSHKYEVVKSVWPYADVERNHTMAGERRVVVQDEEEWFLHWKDSIRHAIMGRRSGWVTSEDQLEFLMEPKVGEVRGNPTQWGAHVG